VSDPAQSGEADADPPTAFYGLFPRLAWAADRDEEREDDADLPARAPEPRLRIVA
jgi:hypothetical protein